MRGDAVKWTAMTYAALPCCAMLRGIGGVQMQTTVSYRGQKYRVVEHNYGSGAASYKIAPKPANGRVCREVIEAASRLREQRADQQFLQACGIVPDALRLRDIIEPM